MPIDPGRLTSDPSFLNAHPDDQIKYVSSFDPDFARAGRADQLGYLGHITSGAKINQAIASVPRPKVDVQEQGLAPTLASGAGDVAKSALKTGQDALEGAGAGAISTLGGVYNLEHKIPGVGQYIAPREPQDVTEGLKPYTETRNTTQKIGKGAEQLGEFLAPGMGEEAAAAKMSKIPPLLAKILYSAGTTGAISAAQSGKPEDALTGAAIGAAGPLAGEVAKPVAKYVGETAPGKMINRLIGVSKKELQYGNNPGRAIANEGIVGSSIEDLGQKVNQKLDELHGQLKSAVGAQTVPIDTSQLALAPIDQSINKAMTGKVANKPLADSLMTLRDSITHDLTMNPTTGAIGRGSPKNLTMTPSDVLDFKREVGRLTRWTPENAAHFDALTDVKRQIYGNLDKAVDAVAPGTEELNNRMSNLLSANSAIERKIPQVERHASFLSRVGLPALGAAAASSAAPSFEHAVGGAMAGVAANAIKDLATSTPGITGQAQLLRRIGPTIPISVNLLKAAAAKAAASPDNQ